MKTLKLYHSSFVGVLLLCGANAVHGQVRPTPPPTALPAPPPAPAVAQPLPPEPPDAATREWHDVKETVVRATKQAREEVAKAHAAQAKVHKDISKLDGEFKWLSGGKAPRVLVVPSGEPNRETVANLEEDLAVMGRVLEKSVDSKERHPSALGMDILTFAGPSAAQHLYVGGHGAIFTLRVKFPLTEPAKEAKGEETESDTASTWEEAKREVFGRGSGDRHVFGLLKELAPSEKEEDDPRKVDRLKDSIVEALKNGTHIRDLAPDERVTVIVTGGGGSMFETRTVRGGYGRGGAGGGGGGGYGGTITRSEEVRHSPRTDTVVSIQAKKADIDAYAKGKIDSDEFRKKVTIVNY